MGSKTQTPAPEGPKPHASPTRPCPECLKRDRVLLEADIRAMYLALASAPPYIER
jgi:hypothetical protein